MTFEASVTRWVLGDRPRVSVGVAISMPGTYRSLTTIGNRIENLSLSMRTDCWYSMTIVILSPGGILATLAVKILGRCCSINEAFLPAFLAA